MLMQHYNIAMQHYRDVDSMFVCCMGYLTMYTHFFTTPNFQVYLFFPSRTSVFVYLFYFHPFLPSLLPPLFLSLHSSFFSFSFLQFSNLSFSPFDQLPPSPLFFPILSSIPLFSLSLPKSCTLILANYLFFLPFPTPFPYMLQSLHLIPTACIPLPFPFSSIFSPL